VSARVSGRNERRANFVKLFLEKRMRPMSIKRKCAHALLLFSEKQMVHDAYEFIHFIIASLPRFYFIVRQICKENFYDNPKVNVC
jgi:hypothetical protein